MLYRISSLSVLLLLCHCLSAAVYAGNAFTFPQPDQTPVPVRIWGNDFTVEVETPDGWALCQDAGGWWCYAQPNGAGGITASATRVGAADPATLGLAKHLRQSKAQRSASIAAKQAQLQRDERGRPNSPLRQAARQAAGQPAAGIAGAPPIAPAPGVVTTGIRRGITLLIRFPDVGPVFTQAQVDDFCNADDYTDFGNNGSVKEYFYDNSLGTLTYTNTVTAYYTAANPRSYYTDPAIDLGTRARELIIEALNYFDATIDYSTCDGDSDGVIDAINAFYVGDTVNNWSEGLWPHQSSLTGSPTYDGVDADVYQITNMGTTGLELGTFCHENGHMICDFPDIYDYDFDSSGGAGIFCLMNSGGHGTNPVRVCGYLALSAGWRTAVDLYGAASGTKTISAESAPIYRYRKPGLPTEYFLIENRSQASASGRDANLPCSGLAIWHCDEAGDHNKQGYTKPSTSANHYEVALIQADNLFHLEEETNDGDTTDLWYLGNLAAGYTGRFEDGNPTNNDAGWWDNTDSGLVVTAISAPGQDMTFVFGETTLGLVSATYSVTEGNSGTTYANITVVRSGSTSGSATLSWTTTDGSATIADLDRPASSGTVTWYSGTGGTRTFQVPVYGDTMPEADETINITISTTAVGVILAQTSAVLTVVNDDGVPPAAGSLELTAYVDSVSEGTGGGTTPLTVTLRRRGGSTGAVAVAWSLSSGTAAVGTDVTGTTSGTVAWADGDPADKTVTLDVAADSVAEVDETFYFTLGAATGGAIAPTPNQMTLTIENDDYEVRFGTSRLAVHEPSAGTVATPITVQRIGTVHGSFSIDYTVTASGTATGGTDFTVIAPGTLSWTIATTSEPTILVPIMADGVTEGFETFSITLSNPVGCVLGTPASATIEIQDITYSPFSQGQIDGTAAKSKAQGGGCGAGATALLIGLGCLSLIGLRRRRR